MKMHDFFKAVASYKNSKFDIKLIFRGNENQYSQKFVFNIRGASMYKRRGPTRLFPLPSALLPLLPSTPFPYPFI